MVQLLQQWSVSKKLSFWATLKRNIVVFLEAASYYATISCYNVVSLKAELLSHNPMTQCYIDKSFIADSVNCDYCDNEW